MNNEIDTQENHEGGNESVVGNVIDDKIAKRKEQDANNANGILVVTDGLKNLGGVPGAIAIGVQTAHKWSGGRSTRALGKMTTTANKLTGPAGRQMQRTNDMLGKISSTRAGNAAINASRNKAGNGGEDNGTAKNNTNAAAIGNKSETKDKNKTTSGTNSQETSSVGASDEAKAIVKKPLAILAIPAMIIIIPVLIGLFIYATIIAALEDIIPDFYGSNNGHGNSSSTITINNVGGVGSYYTSNTENSTTINDSIVYVKEDGENITYSIDDFLVGTVYNMTGDNYSIELYKVYSVLIKSNILMDSDGVIESSNYQYTEVTNSTTLNNIKTAISSTENKLLLDNNNHLIETDFSNNDCEDCAASNGVSLNSINNLINDNKNYTEVIQEIYGENSVVSDVNPSTVIDSNLDIDVKVTTSGDFLHTPIDSFLKSKGSSLNNLNDFIKNNVQPKYGTREGVVIAAVSLINYLHDGYNVRLPYYWGGKYWIPGEKHYNGIGIPDIFGKYITPPTISRGGTPSYYRSFDCSGFVQWAIINGGFKDPSTGTLDLHNKYSKYGCKVINSNCIGEPGDLINAPNNHVQLIVSVDSSNGIYYIAESSGTRGVTVTTRGIHSDKDNVYYILHMGEFYKNNRR